MSLAEGLTVFLSPLLDRRRLRTSNMLERLKEELKRRTRVAGFFSNDGLLLRPFNVVLIEVDGNWGTNLKYLTMGLT